MKKLTVCAVEDDPESLHRLSLYVEQAAGAVYLGGARDLNSAKLLIELHRPDVVLLDVHLGDESGFDLFDLLTYRDFQVIFCTAHEEHAIRAIRFSAVDYLLKPFSPDELKNALNRAQEKVAGQRRPIDHLLSNLSARTFDDMRIALSDSETIHYVPVRDVIRAEATGNYSTFFISGEARIVVSTTLGQYEDLLVPNGFFRTHRAHLVNLRHVVRFQKADGGSLIMTDGATLFVARRRKDDLLIELAKLTR
jgi:two-component system LytT family response regulator